MRKKVTLRKRCGDNNCKDPNCDYVIVEEKGVSYAFKVFKETLGINNFQFIGWLLFVLPPLILFLLCLPDLLGMSF